MDSDRMTPERWDHTSSYIRTLFAREDEHQRGLMERAAAAGLPRIDAGPETGRLLQMLVALTGGRLAIEVGTLAWLLRGRMNGLALRSLASVTLRCTLAAGAMAGALYGWLIVAAGLSSWLILAGALVLGIAVYWALIWALGVPEARQIPDLALRRLRRAKTKG